MGYGFNSEGRSGGSRGYGGGQRRGGFGGNRGGFGNSSPRAPVKEGEEIDVLIESVGEKGDGIAKIKGFVIFVPNTQANQSVRIKVKKVLNKVGFGEVIGKAVDALSVPIPKGRSEEVSDLKADEPKESEAKLTKELENEDELEEQADDEDEEF